MKLGIDVETLKKSNIKAEGKRSERMGRIILFLTAQKSGTTKKQERERERENKERISMVAITGSRTLKIYIYTYIVKRN